jgi:hypothetical protein
MSSSEQQSTKQCIRKFEHIQNELLSYTNVPCPLNDVQIVKYNTDGTETTFYANSLILSCSSPVFQSMLSNPSYLESTTKVITINTNEEDDEEAQIPNNVFLEFLRFCSSGCCDLTLDNALFILGLAQKYTVVDLLESCINYIEENVLKTSTVKDDKYYCQQVLDITLLGQVYDITSLLDNCFRKIRYNSKVFLQHCNTVDHVLLIVQSPDLNIDEQELFLGVLAFINNKNVEPSAVDQILEHIRFPTMTSTFLQNNAYPFLYTLPNFDTVWKPMYTEALKYAESVSDKYQNARYQLKQYEKDNNITDAHFQGRKRSIIFGFGESDVKYDGYRLMTWDEFTVTLYPAMKEYYDLYGGLLNLEYGSQPPYKSHNCCFRLAESEGYVAFANNTLLYPFDTDTKQQNCNGDYLAERYMFTANGVKLDTLPENPSFSKYLGCQHNKNPGVFVSE